MMIQSSMRALTGVLSVVSVLAGAGTASASSTQAARTFTPADMLAVVDIGEVHLSPDGRTVLVTTTVSDAASNRRATVVRLMPATGGASQEILRDGPAGASTFRWSPDSSRVAFIGTDERGLGIWTYHVATGDLTRVVSVERSNAFLTAMGETLAWSPDGRRLAFVGTPDPPPATDGPLVVSRLQYKSRTTFADNRRTHVFVVPASGGAAVALTSGDFDAHSIAWSARGEEVLFVSNREPDPDAFHNYDIFAVDVARRATRQLTTTRGVEMRPQVSPDGRWVAYTATTRDLTTIDSAAEDPHLWVIPFEGGVPRKVNGDLDRRTSAFKWLADSTGFVFSASDSGRTLLYRVSREGGRSEPLFVRDAQVSGFSMATDGSLAFGLTTATSPREVYRLAPGARTPVALTSFNAALTRAWRLSAPETVRVVADDGVTVEGWYYPPTGATGRVPLLLNIHGGPHGMFGYAFDPMVQGYAGRGYAVLNVNPRGSSGYGQRFSDGSLDDWGGRDYRDLMQAVDHVLATRDDVDEERLGVTGRSYGGYMTNWVITQTDRFRAAVSVASVANLISFYATSIYQDLIHAEFSGFPWDGDNYARLWARSPIAHVARVTTPTLFVHGELDNDVHVTEAEAMYMGLRRRGVEAVLARYPREGHAFREPRHRLDQLTRTLAWLDRYLRPGAASR